MTAYTREQQKANVRISLTHDEIKALKMASRITLDGSMKHKPENHVEYLCFLKLETALRSSIEKLERVSSD